MGDRGNIVHQDPSGESGDGAASELSESLGDIIECHSIFISLKNIFQN